MLLLLFLELLQKVTSHLFLRLIAHALMRVNLFCWAVAMAFSDGYSKRNARNSSRTELSSFEQFLSSSVAKSLYETVNHRGSLNVKTLLS